MAEVRFTSSQIAVLRKAAAASGDWVTPIGTRVHAHKLRELINAGLLDWTVWSGEGFVRITDAGRCALEQRGLRG